MTGEQQKAYNAENYPASVLAWLDQETDRAYDNFESRTCESCANKVDHGFGWVRCGKLGTIFRSLDFGCNEWEQIK